MTRRFLFVIEVDADDCDGRDPNPTDLAALCLSVVDSGGIQHLFEAAAEDFPEIELNGVTVSLSNKKG